MTLHPPAPMTESITRTKEPTTLREFLHQEAAARARFYYRGADSGNLVMVEWVHYECACGFSCRSARTFWTHCQECGSEPDTPDQLGLFPDTQ